MVFVKFSNTDSIVELELAQLDEVQTGSRAFLYEQIDGQVAKRGFEQY